MDVFESSMDNPWMLIIFVIISFSGQGGTLSCHASQLLTPRSPSRTTHVTWRNTRRFHASVRTPLLGNRTGQTWHWRRDGAGRAQTFSGNAIDFFENQDMCLGVVEIGKGRCKAIGQASRERLPENNVGQYQTKVLNML